MSSKAGEKVIVLVETDPAAVFSKVNVPWMWRRPWDMECYATAIHETRIESTDVLAKLHPTKSVKPVLDIFPNDSDIESRNPAAVLWYFPDRHPTTIGALSSGRSKGCGKVTFS